MRILYSSIDDDLSAVLTLTDDFVQHSVGVINGRKWAEADAIECLAVLTDRRDTGSADCAQPRDQAIGVVARLEGADLNPELRARRHRHRRHRTIRHET